jgi:hypothetical protein
MLPCIGSCGAKTTKEKKMKKLILFTAALFVAGQASAYAQSGEHGATGKHHRRMMSSHAHWQGEDPGMTYRAPGFPLMVPSYGYGGYGYGGYGRLDDPEAEGRTSGG